jgi:hypothetical protein
MMVPVPITEEMRAEARQLSDEVLENLKHNPRYGQNYTGLSAPDRFYNGYLGELAVLDLFQTHNKSGIYHVNTSGFADEAEFELDQGLPRMLLADVKTASQPTHRQIMMPAKQMEIHKAHYYIGVRLNGDYAEVWGYCSGSDFQVSESFGGKGVRTKYRKLSELTSIFDLMSRMAYGDFIKKT